MERLTHKARYEAGYKLNKGVKEWQAADRLGAYENTGLTPEQIRELKERDTAKAPDYEGDGYDDAGNIIYDIWICPNCGKKYEVDYDDYDFCPDCGQAIYTENLEGMEDERD